MTDTIVSHYKILEKLGEGGMGIVYRAEDTKLKRSVALKFLPPALLVNEDDRRRFVHEAQASAALNHPNIATVFEIDESGAQTFITLEYIEGQSLAEKIKSGPMKLDDAIPIAIQVCEGLQAAHEKGIVHRDVKSQNIMVTAKGQVKILDFGLAKLRGVSVVTKAGTTVGTMGYMSPEQLRGEPVDHRTDIWAIGVVLYEMIAGRRPFQGDYDDAVSYQIINQQPEPLTAIRTGVPMELERIVNKLLSKNASERYQSTADLLVDLRTLKLTHGSGIVQTMTSSAGVAGRKRKWLLPSMGALLLLVVCGGLFSIFKPAISSHQIRKIAVLPLKSLSPRQDQEYVVEGMQNALIEELSRIGSLEIRGKNSVMRFKNSEKSTQEIASALGVDALLEGSAILEGNTIRISLQLIDGQSDNTLWAEPYDREYGNILTLVSTVAREVATRIKANVTPEGLQRLARSRTVDSKAFDIYQRASFLYAEGTPESVRKAHEYFSEVVSLDPQFAPAYASLASTSLDLGTTYLPPGDSLGRRKALTEGRAAVGKSLDLDKDLIQGHFVLANYLLNIDWNLKDAEKEYREAIRLNPGDPGAQSSIMFLLMLVGKAEEALEHARKAEELDPLYWGEVTNVAWALLYMGRYDEALAKAKQAVEMDQASVFAWVTLGHSYFGKGLKREGMLAFARMHELDGNPELAKAFRELPYEQGLLKWVEQSVGSRGPIYNNFSVTALCYELVGKRAEAVQWLEKAYTAHDSSLLELICNPEWASARSDPRVLNIIRRMRLEEYVKK